MSLPSGAERREGGEGTGATMAVTSNHDPEGADRRDAGGVLTPLIAGLTERVGHVRDEPDFQRDPEFIRKQLSMLTRYVNYFSPEVLGQELSLIHISEPTRQ